MAPKKKWIQSAVKHPGALTAKAKRAHESTLAFARQHQHDKGKTGQQARFALQMRRMKRGK